MSAKAAGYDSLLIDLEHTTLSIADGSTLAMAGLACGITPFVRVPYQCGDGFVQRVLDNGAMGVVFPHCDGVGEHAFYFFGFRILVIKISVILDHSNIRN